MLRVATAGSCCTYSTGIGSEVQGNHGSELERAPLWARLTSAEIYPEITKSSRSYNGSVITVPGEKVYLKSRKDVSPAG